MINLRPIIDRINALVAENTEASLTYAALEARLALEKVCYDRLRQCHDYISHDQLKRWQPGAVVKTLIAEVDADAAQTRTLLISRKPAVLGVEPKDEDFVEIGTEIGFNPKQIGELWNALSNLALHVELPKNIDDHISEYGDAGRTRAKIEEVVAELERIAVGNITLSGIGEEVSFVCACGENNKRRAILLTSGQRISCINAHCNRSYTVKIGEDGSHSFGLQSVNIPCAACEKIISVPMREVTKMKYDEERSIKCPSCDYSNRIVWILGRANRVTTADTELP